MTTLPSVRKVVAVEANPYLIKALRWNLRAYRSEVAVENLYVSDGSCPNTQLHIAANHRESQLSDTIEKESATCVTIPSVSIRELLERHGLAEVDLLKMDIEGSEYKVLRDSTILRRFRLLFIEVHGHADTRADFIRQVQACGFEVLKQDGELTASCETIFCTRQ